MCTYKEELCLSDLPHSAAMFAAPLPSVARMPLLALVFSWFSPDLSWAILHHPLNVCKDHSWFYYRGILSLLHARTWHFQKSLYRRQRYSLTRTSSEYRAYSVDSIKRTVHLTFHGLFFLLKILFFWKIENSIFNRDSTKTFICLESVQCTVLLIETKRKICNSTFYITECLIESTEC